MASAEPGNELSTPGRFITPSTVDGLPDCRREPQEADRRHSRRGQVLPHVITAMPGSVPKIGNHPPGSPVVQPVRAGRPVSPGLTYKEPSRNTSPAGAVSCHAPRGDQRLVRTPSRAGNRCRSGRVGRTVRRRATRVPGSHPSAALRGVPSAVRRPAPGSDSSRPFDLPRPVHPAAGDAAARAALPPTAPPPTSPADRILDNHCRL